MEPVTGESLDAIAAAEAPKPRKRGLRHPFRRRTLPPRQLAPYAAAAVVLLLAQPTAQSFSLGLALAAAGQALRLWATGHLLKTEELTVTGPYGYLRHPLYAGALLMGTGGLIMAGPWPAMIALPIGLAFFFGYYFPYKERVEGERLEGLYGDAFRAYRAAVPALWPRLKPWWPAGQAPPARAAWDPARVVENDEHSVVAWGAVAIAAIGLRLVI